MTNELDNLLDAEVAYAEAWIPEKAGDETKGVVVSVSSRDAGYGDYPIITIKTAAGHDQAVHCTNAVLKRQAVEANVSVGDEFGVRFLGEAKSKAGNAYKNFKVATIKRAAGIEAALNDDAPF